MKHKHHDVLVAWAEGRPIQYRYPKGASSMWVTLETEHRNCLDFRGPAIEWRVKPGDSWYRVALMKSYFTATADDCAQEEDLERDKGFVRWLTDRISYEV